MVGIRRKIFATFFAVGVAFQLLAFALRYDLLVLAFATIGIGGGYAFARRPGKEYSDVGGLLSGMILAEMVVVGLLISHLL